MAILQIILSAVLISWVRADDSCPTTEEIAPCTCDGEGFNCMGARTVEEVRRAFRAKFKYGAVRSVWVQGTPITSIPGDLFGNVKSQQFYVEINNISQIDFRAFSASAKTLKVLSLFGNKLVDIDYSGFSQFEAMETLNLGRNQIESIPDSAFNSKSLYAVILAQNKISHIGKNAFKNLPNLGKLEISVNQLTTLGPSSFSIATNVQSLAINLAANRISSVSSTAFEDTAPMQLFLSQNRLKSLPYDSFGELVTRIGQKRGFLYLHSNPFECKGCDYSWIVLNKDILASTISGFTCEDGTPINEISKSKIQCDA